MFRVVRTVVTDPGRPLTHGEVMRRRTMLLTMVVANCKLLSRYYYVQLLVVGFGGMVAILNYVLIYVLK